MTASLNPEVATEAFAIAQGVAACPHIGICRAEFFDKFGRGHTGDRRHFASIPSPDFIGSSYSGLVIVGGNPGLAHRGIHHENDQRMFNLQHRIAGGDQAAFSELMHFLPHSMAHWPQVVDTESRRRLRYDIQDVAYIDLVKCGTAPAKGDTRALFSGTEILSRCWGEHTLSLLELLNPTHILALWKPIVGVLETLEYPMGNRVVGYHSGARHLTKDARYAPAVGVVDDFYGRPRRLAVPSGSSIR